MYQTIVMFEEKHGTRYFVETPAAYMKVLKERFEDGWYELRAWDAANKIIMNNDLDGAVKFMWARSNAGYEYESVDRQDLEDV